MIGLLSGFHAYGEEKEYGKILQVALFVGLLYGIVGFVGGVLLAGAGGLTGFALTPAVEVGLIDAWATGLPVIGAFVGLFLVGVVETHVGAVGRWFADYALKFELE